MMDKKMMLLAFAAVSAALFAIPAVASANWGVDPETQTFSGTTEEGFVGNFSATGEPKITCEGPDHVSGAWTNGTEGSYAMDITGCHVSVFGFTVTCKTSGAPVSNTILTSGKFKNVTIENGKRGITLTPGESAIVCAGISTVHITGSVIGRLTADPASCGAGVIDSSITLEFLTKDGLQTPMIVDGSSSVKDDLFLQTGSGAKVTGALEHKFSFSTLSNTTWTCNAP